MIPDFDIEQVIRASILRLDDLPDMDGGSRSNSAFTFFW